MPKPGFEPRDIVFHPKKFQLSVVRSAVWALILGVPSLIVGPFVSLDPPWGFLRYLILLAPLIWFGIFFSYARAANKRYQCRLEHDGVRLLEGVFWRNETFVPATRIQHTEVTQGPLQRYWSLAELELHTAGTHVGKLHVHGLWHQDALAIRDELLHRTQGAA